MMKKLLATVLVMTVLSYSAFGMPGEEDINAAVNNFFLAIVSSIFFVYQLFCIDKYLRDSRKYRTLMIVNTILNVILLFMMFLAGKGDEHSYYSVGRYLKYLFTTFPHPFQFLLAIFLLAIGVLFYREEKLRSYLRRLKAQMDKFLNSDFVKK